jgi:tape measure domain-containing protein
VAQTVVDIVVKTTGGQKLKQLDNSLKGTAANAVQASTGLDRTSKAASKAGNSAAAASSGFGKLAKGITAAASAIAAFQVGKQIAQVAIDSVEAQRRLKFLSAEFGEVQGAQLAAARVADKFGLSQREAAKSFSQIYARLRPIGISLKDIESAYAGFETSARLSGASAQESSAAFLQLSQALGSGVLRGEELNSIFEQTPGVVKAIADEMGAPIGGIRALAKEGKITSDIVLRALKRLETQGVGQLAEAMNGPRQKFKDFSNSVETLSNALAVTVLPELTDAISAVGETILLLEGPIKYVSGLLSSALQQVNSLIRQITQAPTAAARADIERGLIPTNFGNALTGKDVKQPAIDLFGKEKFDQLNQQAREFSELRNEPFQKVLVEMMQDALKAMDGDGYIKSGLEGVNIKPEFDLDKPNTKTTGGGGTKGAGRESQVPALQREVALAKELEPLYGRIADAQLRGDEDTVVRLQGQQALIELKKEEADILASNVPDAEKQLKLELLGFEVRKQVLDTTSELKELEQSRKEAIEGVTSSIEDEIELLQAKLNGNEDEIKQLQEIERLAKSIAQARGAQIPSADDSSKATGLVKERDELQERVAQADELKSRYEALASSISGAFTSAFRSVIDGSKSADEALGDMFKNIADAFLDMAMKMIQEWLYMKVIGLVSGMFGGGGGGGGGWNNPSDFNSIIQLPSYAGGGPTGNAPRSGGIDGRGGFPAILHPQETVIDHHGGASGAMGRYSAGNATAAAAMAPMAANVTYNGPTLNFNGDEYIPRSEAPALVAAGAKQGQARAMNTLKNSRSQRAKLGM